MTRLAIDRRMLKKEIWNGLTLIFNPQTDRFYADLPDVAAMLNRKPAFVDREITLRNWATFLESKNGMTPLPNNKLRMLDEDQILCLLEEYRSPKLLDFISVLKQHEAFIAE